MPYSDYPQAATDNAQKALDHREEHDSKCGTSVGWRTARILASRSIVTKERLPRIFSFLSRAKTYDQGDFFNEEGNEICGSVMYAAWGGDEMLRWSERKMNELKEEDERAISDLSPTARKALENKVEEHNEEYGDTKTKRVTLGMLTKVYERGVGAYHTNPSSVRPNVTGPEMWAMARVNSFIYAVINERFRSGKHDTDLFPEGHPLRTKEENQMTSEEERMSMLINEDIAIIDDRLAYSTQEKAEEMAESMGLEGFHTHEFEGKTWYMPGMMHSENSYHDEEEEEYRAEADELSVGDFVRWSTSGGNAYGRIIQISSDSDLEADSGFVVTGTPDDPAALIRVYRYDSESDAYIERKPALNVVHKFSTLTTHEAEVRKTSSVREEREFRLEETEYNGRTIRGYATVYDRDSEWMGGFYEQIERGAFDSVMNDDTRAYLNHDENYLLRRVSSGTLRISTDKKGLYYEVDLPNTTYANDLIELMKRGDINQSSFAFLIEQDRWEQRNGTTYRIIEKVSRLLDVSPVAQPAYPDATSELMSREFETEKEEGTKTDTSSQDASVDVKSEEEVSNLYVYKLKTLKL